MSKLTVKKVDSYSPELLDAAIAEQFGALGIAGDLHPGMKVTIKPNLLTGRKPEYSVTTHPEVLKAVIRWLKANGMDDVTVADSPGGLYTPASLKAVYSACDYRQFEEICNLNYNCAYREVRSPEGFRIRSFNLIEPVCDADYVINIAKLKTHAMTGISAGIKNLFGTIPGLQKPEMHYRNPNGEDFADMLIELSKVVAPNVTVIDAIDCMEGNGPGGGDKRHFGALFASRDIYTQDWYAVTRMGYDPMTVPMLALAKRQGLVDMENAELIGDAVEPADPPFKLPDAQDINFTTNFPGFLKKPAEKIMDGILRPMPNVELSKCIGCGKCAESCPRQIIKIENKKARIPRKNCISCFCCQEMCPAHAISVKRKLKI